MSRALTTAAATRRVVVTGLGVVCPLGVGVAHAWPRLVNGVSGVVPLVGTDAPPHLRGRFDMLPSKVGAVVPRGSRTEGKFDPKEWFEGKVRVDQCYKLLPAHGNRAGVASPLHIYAICAGCGARGTGQCTLA